jgi:hypothetical protein
MTTPSKEENKHHLEHTEEIDSDPSPAKPHNEDDILGEYTASEARKIIHRVDRRLVSVVGALYFISLLDRNNLSAAVLAGMATDLHLNVGYRYSIIT